MSTNTENEVLVVFYPPLVGRRMPRPIVMYRGSATSAEEVLGQMDPTTFHEEFRLKKGGGQVYIGWAAFHDQEKVNGRISWWGTTSDVSAEEFFGRYVGEFFAKQSQCEPATEVVAVA